MCLISCSPHWTLLSDTTLTRSTAASQPPGASQGLERILGGRAATGNEKQDRKTSALIPSFLYPQDVYIRTFTFSSEKILFCVISCQVHREFSKANGESFWNLTLFLGVNKKFSIWAVLLKGGFFKDFSCGTSESPNNRGSWMNAENSWLLLQVFSA